MLLSKAADAWIPDSLVEVSCRLPRVALNELIELLTQ